MVAQKDIFWKSAIITLVVFSLGMLLGYYLESNRSAEIREEYKQIETQWADVRLQNKFFQLLDERSCDLAIDENIKFADKVYEQGLKLENYDRANKITPEMIYEKKKYILLKIEFWSNSIYLKEKCNAHYINLVYFYKNKPGVNLKSVQETQGLILKQLKEKYGPQLMFIPLYVDIEISTIDTILAAYNITKIPSILISEEIKLEGLTDLKQIEKVICNQKNFEGCPNESV